MSYIRRRYVYIQWQPRFEHAEPGPLPRSIRLHPRNSSSRSGRPGKAPLNSLRLLVCFRDFLFPSLLVKNVAASLASLQTPVKADSPVSSRTPVSKKPKSPEKSTVERAEVLTPKEANPIPPAEPTALPVHYSRFIEDLRLVDETLSIFRSHNQIPYFPKIRENVERASGRRFTVDHLRQLMTVSDQSLFKLDWQSVKDAEGKVVKYELTVRAVDHEKEGSEIFKRLTAEQMTSRQNLVREYLNKKLLDYMSRANDNVPENAFPVKPAELPQKPATDSTCSTQESGVEPSTPVSGRARVLARCDSVASDGSVARTPKSSLRRQLSVSASPVIPNVLPQFISTPVKIKSAAGSPPKSAKEKLDAIRNRVKAKEEEDQAKAKDYDEAMALREKLDEFDLVQKLLVKLNHKFPRGIDTARISTIKKDIGSFSDVEKWTAKLCEYVPDRFELVTVGAEPVLKLKTMGIKFSEIKKEIENVKSSFQATIRE